MSDWHPKIKSPASFRGVPFFVEAAEQAGGRRTVRHEFPFKDLPFSEDMGRKGRTFSVEAFVVGLGYMDARNALVDALEAAGPGELIHPHYGTRKCAAPNYRVRETNTEGGVARISIEFEETPETLTQPTSLADAAGNLSAGAALATAAVAAEFLTTFSPGALLSSVTGALRSATRAIDTMLAKVNMEVQALATLKRSVDDFTASAGALASAPSDLVAQNVAIFESICNGLVASATVNPCAAILALYHFDPGPLPPTTTPSRVQERANFEATQRLQQRLAIIQAAKVAITLPFASYDDALIVRESITDLLDEQAEIVSDDTFPALQQLRADLVNAIPGDALEFARLIAHTPPFVVPSLVLAQRLYGDVSREQDMIARNRIRNPAFVTGGVELEILSDSDA